MSGRAVAASLLVVLAGGSLAATGTGSSAATATWAWSVAVPGDRQPDSAPAHKLAAAGDLTLVAAERDGELLIGPLLGGQPQLEPLADAAGGGPLVVYSAAHATGNGQELVGVARADVDRIEVTLEDGRTRELEMNEWRGFAYAADAAGEAASAVAAYAGGDSVGAVRLPQTTTQGQGGRAASPSRYTISNRGREVPAKQRRARLFEDHPYELFLLGTRNRRAFYRIQLTPRYTCWGSGKASRIGEIGSLGCPNLVGAYPLQFEETAGRSKPGLQQDVEYLRINGIAVDQAATMALIDNDAEQVATTPVIDNLYSFPPPYPTALVRVVALDGQGRQLKPHPEWGQRQTPPPNLFGPRVTRVRNAELKQPVQRGEDRGVRVSVGSNRVVLFDGNAIEPRAKRLLAGRVAFNCFVLRESIRTTQTAGITVAWAPEIAFMVLGFKPPFDGCEIQGSYGHRWHDQYGTHSVVEIALSQRGGRYFAHRASARDLALFVRSRRTKRIRKQTGVALIAALRREYGDAVVVLPAETATAPAGEVGVWTAGSRTVFSEMSSAGGRFFVELENGKITNENLRGLAFVF